PLRAVFLERPLVCTRNPSGTRTCKRHWFGGTPPVANKPCEGSSSGAQPSEGRKNASEAKLKPAWPAAAVWNSAERWRVWRSETFHRCGSARNVSRGFAGELCSAREVPSQAACAAATRNLRRPGKRNSREERG